MDNKTILDNSTKVKLNQMANIGYGPCERALGSKPKLVMASTLALQYGDTMSLISAHLVMKYCLEEKRKSSEQIDAYREGVMGFITFLTECVTELKMSDQAKYKATENPPTV